MTALVRAAAPGQPLSREEFQEFYERTAPGLRRYLRGIGAGGEADDVLQEAYVRLLGARPLQDEDRKPYLYRVAQRLVVDRWRARQRERNWLDALFRRAPITASPDSASDVERLFQRLPVRQRSLLWLAYVEEASHHEIASILQLEEKSVRVLLFRARRKLETILRKEGYRS